MLLTECGTPTDLYFKYGRSRDFPWVASPPLPSVLIPFPFPAFPTLPQSGPGPQYIPIARRSGERWKLPPPSGIRGGVPGPGRKLIVVICRCQRSFIWCNSCRVSNLYYSESTPGDCKLFTLCRTKRVNVVLCTCTFVSPVAVPKSMSLFRQRLKSHLFRQSYPDLVFWCFYSPTAYVNSLTLK